MNNLATIDMDIRIMEERLKIARLQNESLRQQLNNLDVANDRLEQRIKEQQNQLFWEEVNHDLLNALRTNATSSQMDIVSSAYIYCNQDDLETMGLVHHDYFATAN